MGRDAVIRDALQLLLMRHTVASGISCKRLTVAVPVDASAHDAMVALPGLSDQLRRIARPDLLQLLFYRLSARLQHRADMQSAVVGLFPGWTDDLPSTACLARLLHDTLCVRLIARHLYSLGMESDLQWRSMPLTWTQWGAHSIAQNSMPS